MVDSLNGAECAELVLVRFGAPSADVWQGSLEGRDDSRPLMLEGEYAEPAAAVAAAPVGSRVQVGAWHYLERVAPGSVLPAWRHHAFDCGACLLGHGGEHRAAGGAK